MRKRFEFINISDLNIDLFEFFFFSLFPISMKSNGDPRILLWVVIAFFVNVRRCRLWEKKFYLIL